MDSRRDFLKRAALLSGAGLAWNALPESVARAMAIDPEPGTTFHDAEHVVILMQENRSFDHCFGTLRGVRGFNDPRAHTLPNLNPVWLQSNAEGETYAPFRLDIKRSKATWMGNLPHNWKNQVDARNGGRFDGWLEAKKPGRLYAKMPLTMGHYTREDVPFYYAFADAFTVCDQNFCSSLTGTYPNRLFLWTGTIREKQEASSRAYVYNEEAIIHGVHWTTFQERLEDANVSWKTYQNDLTFGSGLRGEQEAWLANFGTNPAEFFSQFHVRYRAASRDHLIEQARALSEEIEGLRGRLELASEGPDTCETPRDSLHEKTARLALMTAELERWSEAGFDDLTDREKSLHRKAFTVNSGDPDFHELTTITFTDDDGTERKSLAPKGDVFYQFRQDVKNGALPTVSWIAPPQRFSDHPSSPWYGAWYVSEVLDILTQNPEVWKKTIFILTYDENDGYFDHVPPFTAPAPNRPATGRASNGLDTSVDYIDLEQDKAQRPTYPPRDSPIGLGFRVPMVIASPWSRGGCVCSEVFDHTSVIQFVETFLTHKTGRKVVEPNVSPWRRTVCGDLTSAFKPYHGETIAEPEFARRDAIIESIDKAKFKALPSGYKQLTNEEIERIKRSPEKSSLLPKQEPGIRPSCPLPYQLYAQGSLAADRKSFSISLESRTDVFGKRTAGAPFNVYAYGGSGKFEARAYAVVAGDHIADSWELAGFENGRYHLRVDGPNGFHREFKGAAEGPILNVRVGYAGTKAKLNGQVEIHLASADKVAHSVVVRDNAYGAAERTHNAPAGGPTSVVIDTRHSHGWYDFTVRVGDSFEYRYAGRVETGKWTFSDPAMA